MKWALGLIALLATPATAQLRDYCPERPGLDTPPCIVDHGHVSVETALADWTRDDQPDMRTDTVLIGQTVVRFGVTEWAEARAEWTPYGHQRTRDKASGMVDRAGGIGDVTLGVKASLLHPDGEGLSVAVLPQVTLPVGRVPIGAGDWSGGVLLPISYSLSKTVQLEATPEVDAAVNGEGAGRHLAYSLAGGVAVEVGKATLSGELQVKRDDDPGQGTTPALAALSLAVKAGDDLQFDLLGAAGLNHDAPDVEVYAGFARRF